MIGKRSRLLEINLHTSPKSECQKLLAHTPLVLLPSRDSRTSVRECDLCGKCVHENTRNRPVCGAQRQLHRNRSKMSVKLKLLFAFYFDFADSFSRDGA